MCEPGCDCCWFQKTNQVLSLLRSKSEDVTRQLDNASKCMNSVQNTVNDFITSFSQLGTLSRDETQIRCTEESKKRLTNYSAEYPKEGDVVFVKVCSSGLSNDCTFWCTYWFCTGAFPFNDSRLHHISDELGCMVKDLSVEEAEGKASEHFVFCYSPIHKLHLRTVVLKHAPPKVEVRFIDLGRTEFVAPNTTFYKLPEDNPTKYPFLTLHCALYYEDELQALPREARWCFRDQTNEKILMAKIMGCSEHGGVPLYKMEMKTMVGNPPKSINKEVMKKVVEHEKEEERRKEERKKEERMEIERKEKERMEIEQKEKERMEMEQKEKERKEKEHKDIEWKEKESNDIEWKEKERKDIEWKEKERNDLDWRMKERNNNEKQITPPGNFSTPGPDKGPKLKEEKSPPVSYMSEDDNSPGKRGKNLYVNKVTHELFSTPPNKGSRIKKGRPWWSSECLVPENTKLRKVRSSSVSNVDDVDPTSVSLDTEMCIISKAVKEDFNKKNSKEEKSEKDVYWVDLISKELRHAVPKTLVPLRNLFYNKNDLRQAPWYDIELMNINELLNSESKMIFYAISLCNRDIVESFSSRFISIKEKYRYSCRQVKEKFGTSSQYIFILEHSAIIGIAKIEELTAKRMYLQYYCLSSIGNQSIQYFNRSDNKSAQYLRRVDNKFAKTLVLKFQVGLESNMNVPMFKTYYPWCGVPPLMEMKKPLPHHMRSSGGPPPQHTQQLKNKCPQSQHMKQNPQLQKTNQKTRRSWEDLRDNHKHRESSSFPNRDHSSKRGGAKRASSSHNWRQHPENIQHSKSHEEFNKHTPHAMEELWDENDTSPIRNGTMSLSSTESESYVTCNASRKPEVINATANSRESDCITFQVNGSIPLRKKIEDFPTVTAIESAYSTALAVKSDSRSSSCYGYEAHERFEGVGEEWLIDGNCTSRPINGSKVTKQMENGDCSDSKQFTSVTNNNNDERWSPNSDWEEEVKDINHVATDDVLKKPIRILKRDPSSNNNVGFYDGSGMWYPDMDTAVLAYQSTVKVFNDEYVTREKEEVQHKNSKKHYDSNDNLTEGTMECLG